MMCRWGFVFILLWSNGMARQLGNSSEIEFDKSKSKYFKGIKKIFTKEKLPFCLQEQKAKGWISPANGRTALPLYVIAVGTEASGHQMWKMLLDTPIFDCIWVHSLLPLCLVLSHSLYQPLPSKSEPSAGSHLSKSGFPYLTSEDLEDSLSSQLVLSSRIASKDCKSVISCLAFGLIAHSLIRTIYDAFSSFPFGTPKDQARVFNHPDLINLRKLDGVLFNVKYLVLSRNITVLSRRPPSYPLLHLSSSHIGLSSGGLGSEVECHSRQQLEDFRTKFGLFRLCAAWVSLLT
jgi:hypothetical protein